VNLSIIFLAQIKKFGKMHVFLSFVSASARKFNFFVA